MGEAWKTRPDTGMETKARLLSYGLLSRGFSYPGTDIFELDRDEINALLKEIMLTETTNVMIFQGDKEEYLEELQCEYTRLFRNAYPKVPLPPYESVYADGEGLLWGNSTLDVLNCYRETGLECINADKKNNIPDHIAIELEFMAYLASNELEAASEDKKRSYRNKQESFLRNHLLKWAPVFFERVEKETKLEFYRTFARFGYVFLSTEIESLNDGGRAIESV